MTMRRSIPLMLATAMVAPRDNPVAQLFKVPLNEDGFFVEAHVKLRPVDFTTDGVYVCGLAHCPKPLEESIAQGMAAAARAATVLSKERILGNPIVAEIDPERCAGCQGCLNVCPYEAIRYVEERGVCEVNPMICKGCGTCAATCPSGSARLRGFTPSTIYAQIRAALAA